jgi:hypothetical protein
VPSSIPHKAHNLPGSGGGRSKKTNKTRKQYLCQPVKYPVTRNNSPTNIRCINIIGNYYVESMQILQGNMAASGSKKVVRSLLTEEDEFMEIDSPQGSTHKRTPGATKDTTEKSSKKKSKGAAELQVIIPEATSRKYWLGFSYMEQIAREAEIPECTSEGSIEDLVAKGYLRHEVEERENSIISFPRIPQTLYPSARSDKVLGRHYNLTQLPFEVETHPDTGLSLDFHITIYFEQPKTPFEHDEILIKAQERFEQMAIPLGNGILHPITVFCKHTKQKEDPRIWAGIIKAHLLKPEIHAIDLLRGTRPFILQLDHGYSYMGKLAKGFDTVARNNLLSIKFESPILQDITAQNLFQTVLLDNFERNLEYEVIGVQKGTTNTYAWVVTTTPNQAAKVKEHYIRVQGEILYPTIPKIEIGRRRLEALDQKEKRDCLKLCFYNLPKRATMEMITHAIKEKMGAKNVIDIYYHASVGQKHSGKANVECLNPIVYKQFLEKTILILGSYVEFTPHPKSLEGTAPPTEDKLKLYGFQDNNTALVNTIEALENRTTTNSGLTKEDVEAIVEKGGKRLKKEILDEAQAYAEKLHDNMKEEMLGIQNSLAKALEGMQNITTALLSSSSSTKQLNGLG